jgi:uncharacterized protein (DUF1800 family)
LTLLVALLFLAHGAVAQDWTRQDAAHLLRRAGFGGTPQQIDRLHALGKPAAVEYLLTGNLPQGAAAPFDATRLEDFKFDFAETAPAGANLPPNKQRNAQRRIEIESLREWWLDRMVRTDRPLEEKMTLFWHGLFCTGIKEIKDSDAMARQNATFHQHALGNYKALTLAIVHDGAMLRYLNNDQNVKGKPNENLGRELMELFTMGEGQGYTEKDIAEVARALTGLAPSGAGRNGKGKVAGVAGLRMNQHDTAPKTILGQTGNFGPDDVVNLIFARPEPAEHLARRLWLFFASADPEDDDLAPIAAAIRDSNYDVKAGLRALFTSPSFYSERCKFALIKGPVDLCVETLRNLEVTPTPPLMSRLAKQVKEMYQELFQPPNVRGWVGGEHWITSATLFTRYNTATAMVNGQLERINGNGKGKAQGPLASPSQLFPQLKGDVTATQVVDAAIARFLQRPLHPDKKQALIQTMGDAPIHPGQPDTDKRIREVLELIVSTPEYQVH